MSMPRQATLLLLLFFAFFSAYAQNIEVRGVVTDTAGVPMPGVSVFVPDTKMGTTTDKAGLYKILLKTDNKPVQLVSAFMVMKEGW